MEKSAILAPVGAAGGVFPGSAHSAVLHFPKKLFSFPVLLGALLVASVFASVCLNLDEVQSLAAGAHRSSIFEGDTWQHILIGESIWTTHTWPTKDSYSFTAQGNDSMAFEWLAQMAWALVDRLGGPPALAGLLILLATTIMLLLYVYAYIRCRNSKAAFVASLALLPLASPSFTLRPQLVGYIFLLITLICLERFRQGHPGALWVLPPLFVLWVNTHGSFVLGLGVLFLYWASGLVGFQQKSLHATRWTSSERLRLSTVILLSVMALVVTPYGTRLAGFTFHVILNAPLGMSHIVEYAPLGTFGGIFKGFLALLILFLLFQVTKHPDYRLEEVALLGLGIYGACAHMRLLLFFVIVFAPLFASMLARWVPRYEPSRDRYVLNAGLMVLMSLAVVHFFPSNQELDRVIANGFPAGAVKYLQQHQVPGPVFNDDFWGAYLIRSLGPQHKIFIDGRSQLFEESGVFEDYLRIMQVDRQTIFLLRKYGIRTCLISRDSPLATFLAALPDWERVYEDDLSSLFVQKSGPQSPGSAGLNTHQFSRAIAIRDEKPATFSQGGSRWQRNRS